MLGGRDVVSAFRHRIAVSLIARIDHGMKRAWLDIAPEERPGTNMHIHVVLLEETVVLTGPAFRK